MKVFIVGAGGTGSIIAHLLANHASVEAVTVGDMDAQRARKFILPNPKIHFKIINARHTHELAKELVGFDLVINSSMAALNEYVMKAALEAGVNYQDLDSVYKDSEVDQIRFHEQFKAKNITGLFNAAASPGMTNLLAGEITDQLKRIDFVNFRLLEDVQSDIPFTAWSKAIAFEEIYDKPYVWELGKYVERDNFSGEEVFDFPGPFANTRCYLIDQDEIGTIPRYIKTRRADLKIGGTEIELAHTIFKLGLLRKSHVRIGNALITPYEFTLKIWPDVPSLKDMQKMVESGKLRNAHFWASVITKGQLADKKVLRKATIQFPSQSEVNKLYPGATYVSYAAAVSALHSKNIREKGVFPPEALSVAERSPIIEDLRKYGVKITIEETTV